MVQFECMIQDMYNEEYYALLLQAQGAPTIFYKYFSELTEEQMQTYNLYDLD